MHILRLLFLIFTGVGAGIAPLLKLGISDIAKEYVLVRKLTKTAGKIKQAYSSLLSITSQIQNLGNISSKTIKIMKQLSSELSGLDLETKNALNKIMSAMSKKEVLKQQGIKNVPRGTIIESQLLSSSALLGGSYIGDKNKGSLTVTFKHGKLTAYTYPNVPYSVWTHMKEARGAFGSGAMTVFWHEFLWPKGFGKKVKTGFNKVIKAPFTSLPKIVRNYRPQLSNKRISGGRINSSYKRLRRSI